MEKEAIEYLRRATEFEPNNPYRHRTYAIWLLNHPTKENIGKGVVEYKKAIEHKPQLTKEALAKYFKVEKSYKKLKTILPDTPENHYMVMDKLLKAGVWEQNDPILEKT